MRHLLAVCTLVFLAVLSLPAQTQSEMNAEAAADFAKADAALNKTYSTLLAKLEPSQKEALRTAQRAWIGFRDAQAEFMVSIESEGGSMAPLTIAVTKQEVTETRTAQLKTLLKEVESLQ